MVSREQFGKDFKWGVSTAAYQIEGSIRKDGKGLSIWDAFVKKKGKIQNRETGDVSCDFYNNYTKDLALMANLGISHYRFSISWSRILPDGKGKPNIYGIDFYNRVINFCLELGIEPWITLYHWDLPNELEKKGGWTNREIISWFTNYVQCCLKQFGDRVKNWIILNEPMVFTGAGYFLGIHAPGKKGLSNFLSATHHAAMCQAEGGRIVKSFNSGFRVGTTISCSLIEPLRKTDNDIIAAKKMDVLLNRLFIEPLLGMGYPQRDLELLKKLEPFIKQGDEKKLAFDMDFIGIQNYTREIIKYDPFIPLLKARIIKASKRKVDSTLMDWEVYPESIYHVLKKYDAYPNIKELIVTENGAAFTDHLSDGKIPDTKRVKFLKDHISQIYKAKSEGVKVSGYFVWTFLDNFEWAEGYGPRFGLVYVDFKTQQRIVKSSGHWYHEFLTKKNIPVKTLKSKTNRIITT